MQCQLGNYTYPYNPPEDVNPRVKAVSVTDTLGGRYVTDWGSHPSRQDITQTWPLMETAFFLALDTLAALGGTLSFRDQNNTFYTVVALPPTYDRILPGRDAYSNVQLKLHVVSQP